MEWQPIETAPKDRPVMAYVPGGMWTGGNPYLVVERGDDGWVTIDDPCRVEPTHWAEVHPPAGSGR